MGVSGSSPAADLHPAIDYETGLVYLPSFDADVLLPIFDGKTCIPLREVALGKTGDEYIAVRHDVDQDLSYALRFARWEYARNIRSTYFVIHDHRYMGDRKATNYLKELVSLGHEVGLHHHVWSDARGNPVRAKALLERALHLLARRVDNVVGCAAHGATDYNNVDVWNHFEPSDFGLLYEAYELKKGSNYISDNRGTWRRPLEHVPGKQTHLLIHPCHFRLT